MLFGEKLKAIRKEKNISQEQLSEMLNVSRQAVSKWESGASYPETEKLILISQKLNVSIDYLLNENFSYKAQDNQIIKTDNKKRIEINIETISAFMLGIIFLYFAGLAIGEAIAYL